MEINESRVRDVGGRVRRVGDDADAYLQRIFPQMSSSSQHNNGLQSMAILRQAVDRLQSHTKGLADMSRSLGDNMTTAADNHELNEIRQRGSYQSLTPSTGGF